MKLKLSPRLAWQLPLLLIFLVCCTELELKEQDQQTVQDLNLSSRAHLSKELLDSTLRAEKFPKGNNGQGPDGPNNGNNGGSQESITAAAATLVNYAPQAAVSAESTFPGYSVLKIKDGSRNTTVGPSYSWANNHPAGGTLPESVFLKFGTLKNIERIDIYTSSGYALQNYTIQFRTTPTASWITLVTVVGNTLVSRSHTFAPVNLLEVQIICQRGPASQTVYGRLNEVELYGQPEPYAPPIGVENGMLVFNTLDDVDQAISYLEYKYDQYTDAFVSQYPGKTINELNDIEGLVNFNDEQPFIDFENQYGIVSLRSQLTSAEDYWMETTGGDETISPDPDETYMDEVEIRTIVNSYGEVKVGSTYYVFNSDGSYYEYVDTGGGGGGGGGCSTRECILKVLRDRASGQALPANVRHINSVMLILPECRYLAKDKGKPDNGTWRMKWKVKISTGEYRLWGHGAKAITKSWKKVDGKWKRRTANISAIVFGDIVSWADCSAQAAIDKDSGVKKKRRIQAKVSFYNSKAKSGQIKSYHSHDGYGNIAAAITW